MSSTTLLEIDDHSRTIIHIDLDCFYAQVEMLKDPSLRNVPLGVQQKNLLVTCNYVAREHGVKKCCTITEAKNACPNLVLVNGEDLYDYRKMSYRVSEFLQQYSSLVERLGLDENFIDVTNMVDSRIKAVSIDDLKVQGHIFGETPEICQCGCQERLKLGSVIAQEVRDGLKGELNLTSCAGVAHNKLLAKLVGSVHKPNQQTTIFPNGALELMLNLKDVTSIPGVGYTMAESLERLSIKTIEDLHNCSFENLKSALTEEKAKWLIHASYGRDVSVVKPFGKPQSIGLEDSCKVITAEVEIRDKFLQLLNRLIILVKEDGRIPMTIKVTIRKMDKISHRESRQCNLNSNLFNNKKDSKNLHLTEVSENKLMSIIMHLFHKLVNISQPYHITLLGLSFTKFLERSSGKNSIASYFIKNVSVQSITNVESTANGNIKSLPTTTTSHSNLSMDIQEVDVEPLQKKSKITVDIDHFEECSSPSKLRVDELCLTSKENEDLEERAETSKRTDSKMNAHNITCPADIDEEVFLELPIDIQRELWSEWKRKRAQENESATTKELKKQKTLLNYFVRN